MLFLLKMRSKGSTRGRSFVGERYGEVWWAFRRRKIAIQVTIADALRWCGRNMWANRLSHRPLVFLRQIIDYIDFISFYEAEQELD